MSGETVSINNQSDKLNIISAIISFAVAAVPIVAGFQLLSYYVFGGFKSSYHASIVVLFGFIMLLVYITAYTMGLIMSIIIGLVHIAQKQKHGWYLLCVPGALVFLIIIFNLILQYNSLVLLIVLILITAAVYFYLWYYFSKMTGLFKSILKIFAIIATIIILITIICFIQEMVYDSMQA